MPYSIRAVALLPVLAFTLSSPAAVAQSADPMADVNQGKMAFQFSSDLMTSFAANGITVTYKNYTTNAKKGIGFSVGSGTVDLANGVGEVATTGSVVLTQGSTEIILKSFIINTAAGNPILSAIIVVNGKSAGRQEVFQVVSPNPFAAPLQYGEFVTGTSYFGVEPQFASEVNDYFTGTNFGSQTIIGSVNYDVFLTAPAQ